MRKWYIRNFKVIYQDQAEKLGLTWYQNIYGDAINYFNCRSFWKDDRGRCYRVSELKTDI